MTATSESWALKTSKRGDKKFQIAVAGHAMLKGTYWHQPMSLRIQITFPVHKHSMTRHSNSGLNPCLEAVCRTPAGCVAAFIVISCDAM